ncbi:hypothetical protein EOM27_00175 [Candidatus Saccharibacteria bacterium]|nr:hypothetical protein [Candidatus Saccharibacteria bacterium]NCU43386.1 hypothetical protein [Candidatus Saccharibacteria bacterium]
MPKNRKKSFYGGGVSILVVATTFLMVAIIVTSFIRLANRDSQMAASQDLSQSAYDSAQAGIEDAKRALLQWQGACTESPQSNDCAKFKTALHQGLDSQSCKLLSEIFDIGDRNADETLIQSSEGDKEFDQAYTCVKINTETSDYLGESPAGFSKLIPLKSTANFDKIRVSWFSEKDAGSSDMSLDDYPNKMLNAFPENSNWPQNRPSVSRAQFINGDDSGVVFLYPSANAAVNSEFNGISPVVLQASHQIFDSSVLSPVRCAKSISESGYSGYACSVMILLGRNIAPDSGSILNLSFQYGQTTNYKVEMISPDNTVVNFKDVQPVIDSTGRANDQFRRVQSRVELDGVDQPVPEFAVSTDGKFCKTMIIRDNTAQSTVGCR